MQRAFLVEAWPAEPGLQVRLALHSGPARLRDEGNYFGPVVIRCARLRSLAHGGQVLLSDVTPMSSPSSALSAEPNSPPRPLAAASRDEGICRSLFRTNQPSPHPMSTASRAPSGRILRQVGVSADGGPMLISAPVPGDE